MADPLSTYLDWEPLQHLAGCSRPSWEVDIRTATPFDRAERQVVVRIVCRSCCRVEIIETEDSGRNGRTTLDTRAIGYGLPPRRVAGLWLWPTSPWLRHGRAGSDEPHDFLVTAERVDRVTKESLVGQIMQGRGKRGGIVWSANAVPSAVGQYGLGSIRWEHARTDLRKVAAAAKWIAAQVAEDGKDTRTGESTRPVVPGPARGDDR